MLDVLLFFQFTVTRNSAYSGWYAASSDPNQVSADVDELQVHVEMQTNSRLRIKVTLSRMIIAAPPNYHFHHVK